MKFLKLSGTANMAEAFVMMANSTIAEENSKNLQSMLDQYSPGNIVEVVFKRK